MFFMAVVGMSITGFMQPMANGPLFAIMQAHVDPQIQGRVFSMLESMVSAMMPISMLIAAPVAEWIGIRGWLLFGAVGCLVIGLGGFFIPSLMNIEEGSHEESGVLLEQENS
jgi:DHA3 family macrolide efflux protein-like MFS transporter